MNLLPVEKLENIQRLLTGMSIRAIERHTGVHRDTIMRIKRERITKTQREDGKCYATSQANRVEVYGEVIPPEMRLGWTCSVPYCDNPEHFVLTENRNYGRRDYSEIRKQLWACAEGEHFDLIGESCYEKNVVKFRCALGVQSPHFIIRTLPDRSGLRIIRGGSYYDDKKELIKNNPILVPKVSGYSRLNLAWEPEICGDCLLAPTALTAYKMRFRSLGIERSSRDKTQILDVTCGNFRCYTEAHVFSRARRHRTGRRRNDVGSTFLGMFWGTSKDYIAIMESPRCSIRGCAFISHGDSTLCLQHQQFFEAEGYDSGVIDVNDMYADDNGNDALYTTGMLWEDRYNWLNVRKEGTGSTEAEKQNDQWWHENVIMAGLKVEGIITPRIKGSVLAEVLRNRGTKVTEALKPGVDAHTSLHGKMRNHSKKKIRRVQRNRPAGWHGGHGDHDPQYFTRESIRALEYDDFQEDGYVEKEME